jgi:hypothetical protein
MANELTTLIQVVVSRMCVKNSLHDLSKVKVDCFNDDFRAIGTYDDVQAYRDIDTSINKRLGFILSEEKTRILEKSSVFLEQYIMTEEDQEYTRDVRKLFNLINISFAHNICEAKQLSRSIYEETTDLFIRRAEVSRLYCEIIAEWGYEFYSDEIFVSDIFGGWYTSKYYWHDESMVGDKFFKFSPMHMEKAYEAEKVKPYIKKCRNTLFSHFSNVKLRDFRAVTDKERLVSEMADLILNNKLSVAHQLEVSLTEAKVRNYYWTALYENRQRKYKERLKGGSFHHSLAQKVMTESIRLFGIDPTFVHKWKSNYSFVEQKKFTTFRIEDPDINRNFRLQEKYLYSKDCLKEYEEIELAVNSCLYPYVKENDVETEWLIDLSEEDLVECDELLAYEVEYAINLTYYDTLYMRIPVEFRGIELPKRLENLDFGMNLHRKISKFQRYFPVTLPDSVLVKYEKMIPPQATADDRIYFYRILKELAEQAEKNEWTIDFVNNKLQLTSSKIPESKPVDNDDLDMDIYADALARKYSAEKRIEEQKIVHFNVGGLSAAHYMQMDEEDFSSDSEYDSASSIEEIEYDEFEEDYLDFG